jgi:NADPH:quinone reductase
LSGDERITNAEKILFAAPTPFWATFQLTHQNPYLKDLVLDTIGGETIQRSLEIIRPFGRLASIVDIATPQSLLEAWGKNLTIHFVLTPQYRAKLEALTKLIERHQLRPVIDSVLPWDQVVLAHQRIEQGGTRGKIVLKFTEN